MVSGSFPETLNTRGSHLINKKPSFVFNVPKSIDLFTCFIIIKNKLNNANNVEESMQSKPKNYFKLMQSVESLSWNSSKKRSSMFKFVGDSARKSGQRDQTVKSAVIGLGLKSTLSFCCVLGKKNLQQFLLLGCIGKQF